MAVTEKCSKDQWKLVYGLHVPGVAQPADGLIAFKQRAIELLHKINCCFEGADSGHSVADPRPRNHRNYDSVSRIVNSSFGQKHLK